ncbi:MAG: orotidine-5'-phosphate decarboxylase [Microbacteriaceae bacterium]|nr:orotidine-5'-phosphate decarboxylase [Microbacteriaceae bacterium]
MALELAAKRHLCAGIDPSAAVLTDWGLPDSAASAERLGREVVAASAGVAACVKPQVAFFERFGAAGFTALERVLSDAREAGVLVIADAKRGDIGTSLSGYADAWLTPGSPLEADAMTVVAYQGFGSLTGALDHVRDHGKGLFVLAATSNPEARAVQTARREDGRTVTQAMVEDALAYGHPDDHYVNSVGVVLGATLTLSDFGIDTASAPAKPALPVLAPGFGAQGARIEDAKSIFGGLAWAMLANESRGILAGGEQGLADRIRTRAEAIAAAV